MSEHANVKPIFRTEVAEAFKQPRVTRGYFTKYEYTTLVGTRARQLEEGAKPLVELTGLKQSDPAFVLNVAKREIAQQKLPFVIRRQLPDGTAEFWSAQEMEVMW